MPLPNYTEHSVGQNGYKDKSSYQIQVSVIQNRDMKFEILGYCPHAGGIPQTRIFGLIKSLSFSWKCLQFTLINTLIFVVSECFSVFRKPLLMPFCFSERFHMANKQLLLVISCYSMQSACNILIRIFIYIFFFFFPERIYPWNSSYLQFSVTENQITIAFLIHTNSKTYWIAEVLSKKICFHLVLSTDKNLHVIFFSLL